MRESQISLRETTPNTTRGMRNSPTSRPVLRALQALQARLLRILLRPFVTPSEVFLGCLGFDLAAMGFVDMDLNL